VEGLNSTSANIKTVQFGFANVSGLAGKMHRIEKSIEDLGLDFIFASETWCGPGQTSRLGEGIMFPQEQGVRSNGRFHYGQALVRNVKSTGPSEFTMLKEDLSGDKSYMVFQFRGTIFCCFYLKPAESVEWFEGKLEEINEFTSLDSPVVMIGDFNARSKAYGDWLTNSYGTVLTKVLEEADLTRVNPRGEKWTFCTEGKRSIVDHLIVNEGGKQIVQDLKVCKEVYIGNTDHHLVVAKITEIEPRTLEQPSQRSWNRWRLKEEEVVGRYRDKLDRDLDGFLTQLDRIPTKETQQWADEADRLFIRYVETALHEEIGLAPPPKRWAQEFMSKDLIQKEKICEWHYLKWQEAQGSGPKASLIHWEMYCGHRKDLDLQIRARKTEMFHVFAEKVDKMSPSERLRCISRIRTSKGRNGCLLKTDEGSMDTYRNHYAKQFSNDLPCVDPVSAQGAGGIKAEPRRGCPFSIGLVEQALARLPRGKAGGNSGLINEALIEAADILSVALHPILVRLWDEAVVPNSWSKARIQPVPKKGDLSFISNYRPISLTEAPRKVYEGLLMPLVVGAASLLKRVTSK
jgi:Endonuclease-reverse transcriptase